MSTLKLKKPNQPKNEKPVEPNLSCKQFFTSFEVIQQNNLLTIGFRHELSVAYGLLENPGFSKRSAMRLLDRHCNQPEYREKDKYGIRYNIDNIITHKLTLIEG